ncbi:MAG: hypothetical protein RIB59_04950 [Rhodospirillales bacterium]
MPPSRLFEELGRREGTILTAGPGGRKNPLLSEKEREDIHRRYRHFNDRGKTGTDLMQRASLLAEEDNDGDDGSEKSEACPDLTSQVENIKRTIRDIEKLIEDWKRKIQETKGKISDIAFEIVVIRIKLGLTILGGVLKLIPPARIPGIVVSAIGAGKTSADLFQKEKELATSQRELSDYQDELSRIQQRLAEAQNELENLLARQKECQGKNNGGDNGNDSGDKLA